jgi:hypothetical protein
MNALPASMLAAFAANGAFQADRRWRGRTQWALGDRLLGSLLSPRPVISHAFLYRHDDDQARADERSYCPA